MRGPTVSFALLQGFFGSSFVVSLVVLAVVVVAVVPVVSVAELVVCCACVCVCAGGCSAGSDFFVGSQANALTTSNPVAIQRAFFMYNLLTHTIAPRRVEDLTAV